MSGARLVCEPWTIRGQKFEWGTQTFIMGILNVTPDSFSDGGLFNTLSAAVTQAQHLVAGGAHILDIGGQSTRPQADQISLEAELERVIPVIQALRSHPASARADQQLDPVDPAAEKITASVPISVDTTRAAVARAAIEAGADLVNDISGATYDPEMLLTVAELQVPIVLMHIRGTPKTMQQLTDYQDVVGEIYDFLAQRTAAAVAAGVDPQKIILDPGIGFAKTYAQNLEILRNVSKLRTLGCPILIGASRKSFLGHILNQSDPKQRVFGTAAACCAAIAGGADILRVHDVAEISDVSRVSDAIWRN
ncbi:MAG: dihydropteroate synthase [Elainellaceae cyanobacterium]